MTPFIADEDFTLYVGNCLDVLREMPDESVDCCVTSPPYWGLRDYGTEGEVWGCDHDHEHEWGESQLSGKAVGRNDADRRAKPGEFVTREWRDEWSAGTKQSQVAGGVFCACGAWRGQLGLEPTPHLFVAHLVELFREVRRVLARHGTVWLNLGDSYIGGGRGGPDGTQSGSISKAHADAGNVWGPPTGKIAGLKSKDLVGIPWRVAFALQDDGWWLRSDNIWAKPNPMPESVTDRPTKSHEYVFLLTKTATPHFWTHPFTKRCVDKKPEPDLWWFPPLGVDALPASDKTLVQMQRELFTEQGWKRRNVWEGHDYYYDQEPTREEYVGAESSGNIERKPNPAAALGAGDTGHSIPWSREVEPDVAVLTLGDLPPESPRGPDGRRNTHVEQGENSVQHRDGERWANTGRNMRTVWEITVQPYRDAHFATFPSELPRRCILSGCPEEVCVTCGKPRVRLFEKVKDDDALAGTSWDATYEKPEGDDHGRSVSEMYRESLTTRRRFLGWSDCGHENYRRGIVLDPFMGSGTTAKVARDHGRHAVGIELNEKYAALIADRTRQLSLGMIA